MRLRHAVLSIIGLPTVAGAQDWQQATNVARAFVQRETPVGRLPIAPEAPGAGSRRVFADYTPALPIAMDGQSADYYSRVLPRGGEPDSAVIRRYGIWEEPLPTENWPQDQVQNINAAIDVRRAARIGLDGFIIDLININSGRYWDTAMRLLHAAEASGTNFRIVPEPDMDVLKSSTIATLSDALMVFAKSPAGYKDERGRLLVAPYRPEDRPIQFWKDLSVEMARRGQPIGLISDTLSVDASTTYASASVGLSFWGGRDARSGAAQAAAAERLTKTTGLPVMLPVAPQDFRPKSGTLWEAGNTAAYRAQWETAIGSKAPWIHLITWNDYTEGTEIAPSSTIKFLYYDLTAYYVAWLKQGAPPPVEREALMYAYRNQIFDPASTAIGQAYKVVGSTPISNDIEVLGFLRAPATIEVIINGKSKQQNVNAGVQVLRMPAEPGTPTFRLSRGNESVISLTDAQSIDPSPAFKDGLYGGGSSLRPAR